MARVIGTKRERTSTSPPCGCSTPSNVLAPEESPDPTNTTEIALVEAKALNGPTIAAIDRTVAPKNLVRRSRGATTKRGANASRANCSR